MQKSLKYFYGDWDVPKQGYDVINNALKIYVEMKNKHNTMNSASAQKTYIKMQHKILRDDEATCYLVEAIAKNSQDKVWKISIDGEQVSHKKIRRISIDKFYEKTTGVKTAFKQLCEVLPMVISDVVTDKKLGKIENTVFEELNELSPNLMKSIYILSFKKYEGFSELSI